MKFSTSLVLVGLILLFGCGVALFLHGQQSAPVVDEVVGERVEVTVAPAPVAPAPLRAESAPVAPIVPVAPAVPEGEEAEESGKLVAELAPENEASPPLQLAAEEKPLPPEGETSEKGEGDLSAPPVSPAPPSKAGVVSGVVSRGDTAVDILQPFMDKDSVNRFLRASGKSFSLTQLRAGQPFEIVTDVDGSVARFAYEIDRQRQLVVERGQKGLASRVEPIAYDSRVVLVHGKITSSLFQAFTAIGESPNLTMMLADIFASEINFIKDLRVNDSFMMLVEKRYRNGEFKHYGRVLGARFVNRGKTFEAFRYPGGAGSDGFYTGKGESVRKVLLQSPLSVTRITSNYSLNRKHPVFFDNRPHEGVDYGAPTGTPVKAVGDGQVSKAGWGNGFGNMVILRHTSSLESMYSHLSGFAKGVKEGVRVKQGQVIGYVGATGVATGPHLDFRLRQNGKYVDPTKAVNPRAEALAAKRLREFEGFSARVRACFDGKRDPSTFSAGKAS